MTPPTLIATSAIQPIEALVSADAPATLAVITGVEGPSYRPVGAVMALIGDKTRVGSLSSGCVEADIALHARAARDAGRPARVRYGQGSPFLDITLPCGGGLDILLLPAPDRTALAALCERHAARLAAILRIDAETGEIDLEESGVTGWDNNVFRVEFKPEILFHIFGKGPETSTFAALVQSTGYPNLVLSPDDETLAAATSAGCATRHLTAPGFPTDLRPDSRAAVVLFFHDHEWEPPILAPALNSPAFYIGAQGSRKARAARDMALKALGLDDTALARLAGPIGLIPSARDARTLAVSVLAEILAKSG